MRILFLLAGLLLNSTAFANDVEFPVRCQDKILTPLVAALCTEHRAATFEAEEKYLKALSEVKSVADWKALQTVQATFLASYYLCAVRGEARAVAACLTPAFQNFLGQLPKSVNDLVGDIKANAHNANLLVLSKADLAFKECTVSRINSLDDGISPARDIALAISTFCRPQASDVANVRLNASTTFLIDFKSLNEQQNLVKQLTNADELVGIVLENRAEKRSKPQQLNKRLTPTRIES